MTEVAAPQRHEMPYVLASDEGEALWFLGTLVTLKATGADTHGALTVAHFVNPAGFAPPVHRHLREDEMFYVLSGQARFHCQGEVLDAGPGAFVLLPRGQAHTFVVGPESPLHALQLTTPAGFEDFAALVGGAAPERRLPDPAPLDAAPVDPAAIGHAAALHHIEILGPPPTHQN